MRKLNLISVYSTKHYVDNSKKTVGILYIRPIY